MQWSDDVRIETPEQIEVALELAGLGSRFLAQFTDWVIKALLLLLLLILVLIIAAVLGLMKGDGGGGEIAAVTLSVIAVVIMFLFMVGYDVYFEVRRNGQTPGKRQAGIRVVRENGAPVDFRTSCVRNFLAIADFMPGFFLLGALLVQLTSKHQRLGDMAAGTVVIRERAPEVPIDLTSQIGRLATDEFSFKADQLSACPAESRNILRSFFQRYRGLEPRPRSMLAARLAQEFALKMAYVAGGEPLAGRRAETFLASLYRDLDNLRQHGR